jgi:L-iditol 2-dehydrogenase
MMMQALQLVQPRTLLKVQVPLPQMKAGISDQILVRTKSALVCGSDISFFIGGNLGKSYPLPPGAPIHECTGQVVESTSSAFRSGDWVVAIPEGNQGLAEFFIASVSKTVFLPTELAGLDYSCLIQPLSTVLNAVDRLGEIEGKSVGIVGLGSIGLLFCWLLKKRGAGRMVGIDPCADRCSVAEELGVEETYAMRSQEVIHVLRQEPGWDAPEICIEAVGHQTDTLNHCFHLIRKQGTVLAFGVPDHLVYPVEYEVFFRKNASLIAVVTPVWSEYLTKARDLFWEYHGELSRLVTHRFPMEHAELAFIQYERHQEGMVKALLDATSW